MGNKDYTKPPVPPKPRWLKGKSIAMVYCEIRKPEKSGTESRESLTKNTENQSSTSDEIHEDSLLSNRQRRRKCGGVSPLSLGSIARSQSLDMKEVRAWRRANHEVLGYSSSPTISESPEEWSTNDEFELDEGLSINFKEINIKNNYPHQQDESDKRLIKSDRLSVLRRSSKVQRSISTDSALLPDLRLSPTFHSIHHLKVFTRLLVAILI